MAPPRGPSDMKVIWLSRLPDTFGSVEDGASVVWYVRLDQPLAAEMAARCRLSAEDLCELAGRPDALMRGVRRRLAKVLLATILHIHPDEVCIARGNAGAPAVLKPKGWHVSLAGQWPHCLVGVARQAIGVDIEPVNGSGPPIDAFTSAERQLLAQHPLSETTPLWVLKEAHAKCHGIASQIEAETIETRLSQYTEERAQSGSVWSPGFRSECTLRKFKGTWQAVARVSRESSLGC